MDSSVRLRRCSLLEHAAEKTMEMAMQTADWQTS